MYSTAHRFSKQLPVDGHTTLCHLMLRHPPNQVHFRTVLPPRRTWSLRISRDGFLDPSRCFTAAHGSVCAVDWTLHTSRWLSVWVDSFECCPPPAPLICPADVPGWIPGCDPLIYRQPCSSSRDILSLYASRSGTLFGAKLDGLNLSLRSSLQARPYTKRPQNRTPDAAICQWLLRAARGRPPRRGGAGED
jgi:hypothetical protein